MSTITIDSILTQIDQLPAVDRKKLIIELTTPKDSNPKLPQGKIISVNAPYIDRTSESEWLRQHQREYIGQWIALKGNQLIAQGETGREVFAKVRELGIERALVHFVEDPDLHYMGI